MAETRHSGPRRQIADKYRERSRKPREGSTGGGSKVPGVPRAESSCGLVSRVYDRAPPADIDPRWRLIPSVEDQRVFWEDYKRRLRVPKIDREGEAPAGSQQCACGRPGASRGHSGA
jgi:hypothetical protein